MHVNAMATAVRISEKLVNDAKKYSRIDHRSLTGQIEHWTRMWAPKDCATQPKR